jgi:hypothetical protein
MQFKPGEENQLRKVLESAESLESTIEHSNHTIYYIVQDLLLVCRYGSKLF